MKLKRTKKFECYLCKKICYFYKEGYTEMSNINTNRAAVVCNDCFNKLLQEDYNKIVEYVSKEVTT